MSVILLNCVTLGMYQPCEDDVCETNRCKVLEGFDHFIFTFFAIEMIIKLIAMGLYGKYTYLAETWNRLDMFIVLAGALEYTLNTDNLNLSAIRTIRVLRPLRAINRIPSMRILVMLLLDTLPMLGNVLLLCFFVFFIFGIIGVQLWAGLLRQRCFLSLPDNVTIPVEANVTRYYFTERDKDYICSKPGEGGMSFCHSETYRLPHYKYRDRDIERCNESAKPFASNLATNTSCVNWNQYYTECRAEAPNPFQGAISFDNIGLAWVAIFQVISLAGWVNIMYHIQDVHSFWDFIYFVSLIVIGAFFMINLCLVVIATQFSETKKRETERMVQERKRFYSSSTLASVSEPGGCYDEIVKYISHLCRRLKRKFNRHFRNAQGRRQRKVTPEKAISLSRKKRKKLQTVHLHHHHHFHHHHYHISNSVNTDTVKLQAPRASPDPSDIDPMPSPLRPSVLIIPNSDFQYRDLSLDSLHANNPNQTQTLNSVISTQQNAHCENSTEPCSHVYNVQPACNCEALNRNYICSTNPLTRASSLNHRRSVGSYHRHRKMSEGHIHSHEEEEKTNYVLLELLKCQNRKPVVLTTPRSQNQDASVINEQINLLSSIDSNKIHEKPKPPNSSSKQSSIMCAVHNLELHNCNDQPVDNNNQINGDELYAHSSCALHDIEAHAHHHCVSKCHSHCSEYEYSASDDNSDDSTDFETEKQKQKPNCWNKFRRGLKRFVDSNYFTKGILVAILINTLSMGIEHHRQPEKLTLVLEYSNLFFSVLFALEMLLKLISEGIFGYVKNGFNVLDGVIVILGVVELFQGGTSGLSVLRTFRLLRILKLVRFLPALRYQLVVMLRTMDNVATFFALLVLFIFIFSVLGMHLFGGKFTTHPVTGKRCTCQEIKNETISCRTERKNFDSLLWSLVTVFQILTQEDWNEVLYNGMAKTSAWAALYFIALMTFGNYVLFNLLVAILVEGFSTEGDERKSKDSDSKDKAKATIKGTTKRTPKSKNVNKLAEERDCLIKKCNCHLKYHPKEPYLCSVNSVNDVKNNKEKEKKLFGIVTTPPPCQDREIMSATCSLEPLNPPLITHTAATPMPTPQGSSSEIYGTPYQNPQNLLTVEFPYERDALSVERPRGSRNNLLSPHLSFKESRSSWFGQSLPRSDEHLPNGDNEFGSSLKIETSFQQPTPLNNQRVVRQHSFGTSEQSLHPNSYSCSSSKSNMNLSRAGSQSRSITLSRENSLKSERGTLSPQNSFGSTPHEEYKQNNLAEPPESNGDENTESEDDIQCKCTWCPEPVGCCLNRIDYTLFILSPENKLRKLCQRLICKKSFDYTVLLFIALNCITLAMERPDIPDSSTERKFLAISNYIFTTAFTLEMMVKVIAQGFVVGKKTYLRSGWNIMDGFLVFISLLDLTISLTASTSPRIFGILRVFRLLRTLKPLRVISRAPGLKLVVQTLLSSLRPIGNIVLICCTFFIIFGILGVQLFKGKFYYCDGSDLTGILNKTDCLNKGEPYRWVNRKYNFDNLGQALMSLFVLASKDGWVNIMYTGLDAVDVDMQPQVNYSEWRLLYFISFLLLVGFFVLNMFVGVVVENFHKCRESQEKEERARRAAKRAKRMEKKRRHKGQPPYWAEFSRVRKFIHTVTGSKYFDLAIAAVIGLNVITMALEYYMMPKELMFALKIFNYFFTSVFILEAVVKVIALGFVRYIKDRWNQLDVLIAILSVVGIILEEMKSGVIPINPTIIRVMRVLRIARVLKLLKMAKGIRALLDTVIQALPQVGNLGLLFFLLFFIFAALGVELFGRLECSDEHPCEGLSKHAHFRNFGIAFLTLFRVATGDNWNGIMKDTLREDCNNDDDCIQNCCVSPIIAPVFFVVFVLMAQFVLVNVVVAVLMKHLEESHKQMDDDADLEVELQKDSDDSNDNCEEEPNNTKID